MEQLSVADERSTGAPAPATQGRLIHWARWYDPLVAALSLGQNRAFRRQTAALAGIRPGDRVLDVGCGTGDLTLMAAATAGARGEVVGIDASPEMIEMARQKAARQDMPVRFELAPIERLPFPDHYFDVALSSLMLHHLPGQLRQDGLAEVYRVLKPGGRLLVVDMRDELPGLSRVLMAVTGHGSRQRRAGNLRELLHGAGFAVGVEGSLAAGMLAYVVCTKGSTAHA